MKLLKRYSTFIVVCSLLFNLYSCSECNNENPRARVTNLGAEEVSVQINTSDNTIEDIKAIEPGKSSEFRSYSPGEVKFVVVLKNNTELEAEVEVDFCTDYEIIVEKDNSITIIPTGIE